MPRHNYEFEHCGTNHSGIMLVIRASWCTPKKVMQISLRNTRCILPDATMIVSSDICHWSIFLLHINLGKKITSTNMRLLYSVLAIIKALTH